MTGRALFARRSSDAPGSLCSTNQAFCCRPKSGALWPHAADTNPDEGVWCWTKFGPLCNLAPVDVAELRTHIWQALVTLKNQPQLLTSVILHARVPLQLS